MLFNSYANISSTIWYRQWIEPTTSWFCVLPLTIRPFHLVLFIKKNLLWVKNSWKFCYFISNRYFSIKKLRIIIWLCPDNNHLTFCFWIEMSGIWRWNSRQHFDPTFHLISAILHSSHTNKILGNWKKRFNER